MNWSVEVARIKSIPIKLHITFILLWGFVSLYYIAKFGIAAGLMSTGFIISLFISVLLHELGHSIVAQMYGINVRDITLLPIGGVSGMEKIPEEPKKEIAISIAGPMVSFSIAFVILVYLMFTIGARNIALSFSFKDIEFLPYLMIANIILGVFNIIPAFPMDGGRILRAILAFKMEYSKATKLAANIGQIFAIIMAFLGIFYNIWLIVIAIFIYFAAGSEERDVEVKSYLKDIKVNDVMATNIVKISPDENLADVLKHIYHGCQEDFPVVKDEIVKGILTKNEILTALHEKDTDTLVKDVMKTDFQYIHPDEILVDVFERMKICSCSSLPVVKEGKILGIITLENIGRYFVFESARKK